MTSRDFQSCAMRFLFVHVVIPESLAFWRDSTAIGVMSHDIAILHPVVIGTPHNLKCKSFHFYMKKN